MFPSKINPKSEEHASLVVNEGPLVVMVIPRKPPAKPMKVHFNNSASPVGACCLMCAICCFIGYRPLLVRLTQSPGSQGSGYPHMVEVSAASQEIPEILHVSFQDPTVLFCCDEDNDVLWFDRWDPNHVLPAKELKAYTEEQRAMAKSTWEDTEGSTSSDYADTSKQYTLKELKAKRSVTLILN